MHSAHFQESTQTLDEAISNENVALPPGTLRWNSEDVLTLSLPFVDCRAEVPLGLGNDWKQLKNSNSYIDSLLIRACYLAEHSTERAAKIAATELLHKLVTYAVGVANVGDNVYRNEKFVSFSCCYNAKALLTTYSYPSTRMYYQCSYDYASPAMILLCKSHSRSCRRL